MAIWLPLQYSRNIPEVLQNNAAIIARLNSTCAVSWSEGADFDLQR